MSKHKWAQKVLRRALGFDELWLSSFRLQESSSREDDLKRELHMEKHGLYLSVSAHRVTECERDMLKRDLKGARDDLKQQTEQYIRIQVEAEKLKMQLRVARRRRK